MVPTIKMLDAAKYYKGLPGQVKAFQLLDGILTEDQKVKFQDLYRDNPPVLPKNTFTDKVYIYCRWSGQYDNDGLKIFGMYLINEGKPVDKVAFRSGQSYAQDVVWPLDDTPGSMRPLPEGIYTIGHVDDLGYDPPESDGFGRYVIFLEPQAKIQRGELRVHVDWNKRTSAGSAGCACPYDKANLLKIIGWLKQSTPPKNLVMDHDLGFLKTVGFTSVPDLGK